MKTATNYLTFETSERRELIRISEQVQATVDEAGIAEELLPDCEFDGRRRKRVVIKAMAE